MLLDDQQNLEIPDSFVFTDIGYRVLQFRFEESGGDWSDYRARLYELNR